MSDYTALLPATNAASWAARPFHRQWLMRQANNIFDFFQKSSINPAGGFFELDDAGNALDDGQGLCQIHTAARMVHCFAIGSLIGRPGSDEMVDHGMQFIWSQLRDKTHGGYYWSANEAGPVDRRKQAYGHAFVLLAAASAKLAGHELAEQMLADITAIIEQHFWDDKRGAVREEFSENWSPVADYNGQNSNMHMTEALMAAYEATSEKAYLDKAERIAELIINQHAAALDYRVAEHFNGNWQVDKAYRGNEMFRPAGTTPGHSLEWSRLLLQLWTLGHKRLSWMTDAARQLFRRAIELGWDAEHGGFFYTLDWDDKPAMTEKLWWPVAEAIGAAAFLSDHDREQYFQVWYRKLWDFAANHLIDIEHGGWRAELHADLTPSSRLFTGKPDIYHALQACLIPLYPSEGSLTRGICSSDHTRTY